jgi:chromosome partitioning protein
MAVVVTVAQQKGGAGKTMLAANLAAVWAGTRRVALLDIDPQRSLTRWHAIRPAHAPRIDLSGVSGWRLANELDRLQREHDVVVVDTPPQIDADSRRAIRVAALVLVPLQPSAPDLWAAEGTLALAREERRPVAMLLNRAPTAARALQAAVGAIAAAGHTLLPVHLANRIGYAHAFAAGLGVVEAAPRTAAAAEMAQLAAAIERLLG